MESEVNIVIRERLSITLPKDIVEWIDAKVTNRTYHNRSHAIEVLVRNEMQKK